MKSDKLLTILTVVLIGVLLVLLQSCKHDDAAPDDLDVFTKKFSQTWQTHRVAVDDIDVTSSFPGMTITFRNDLSYSVANPVAPIWPSAGKFEVTQVSDDQYNIKRSDGVVIEVISLTESGVILELLYTPPTGRVAGVSGKYQFEMTR